MAWLRSGVTTRCGGRCADRSGPWATTRPGGCSCGPTPRWVRTGPFMTCATRPPTGCHHGARLPTIANSTHIQELDMPDIPDIFQAPLSRRAFGVGALALTAAALAGCGTNSGGSGGTVAYANKGMDYFFFVIQNEAISRKAKELGYGFK